MLGIDTNVARKAWAQALIYAAVVLSILLIYVIRKTIFVFILALMLAYLLYPIVDGIERRMAWKTRTPAVAIPFAVIICLLALFSFSIADPVRNETAQIAVALKNPTAFKQRLNDWRPFDFPLGETIVDNSTGIPFAEVLPKLNTGLRTVARDFGNLFIVPILSFFILKDGRRIRESLLKVSNRHQDLMEGLMRDAHSLMLEYMRAILLLCCAALISFTIVLKLMNVPYAILLALATFALEFIPLAGPLISAVIILGVSAFNGYQHLGWLIAFLVIYRLFQDYVLSPHLMRRGVKLDPLLILFGIFAGGEIGGIAGIFLSVPILALLRLLSYELAKKEQILPRTT